MDVKVQLHDGYYVAEIKKFWIVTDWKTIDELIYNIKEALDCHYEEKEYSYKLDLSKFLFSSTNSHASELQTA